VNHEAAMPESPNDSIRTDIALAAALMGERPYKAML
jgi:hypothetical protein